MIASYDLLFYETILKYGNLFKKTICFLKVSIPFE